MLSEIPVIQKKNNFELALEKLSLTEILMLIGVLSQKALSLKTKEDLKSNVV